MNRIIFNQCIECGRKDFNKSELDKVMRTGLCNCCSDYLSSDDCIAHREGIADENIEVEYELIKF